MIQDEFNENILQSVKYLLEQVREVEDQQIKTKLILDETRHRLQHTERQIDDLKNKEIEDITFDLIKKITEENIKNGDIHGLNSKQNNKGTVRSIGYILL